MTRGQAAGALHAVRRRGDVPEPGALGRRRGAGERAPLRLAGRRRAGHRRRRARSTWRWRGAWSSWAAPRATPRPSRRASRWPRWSSRCPKPRRAPSSASATSCSTSSTSRTCAWCGGEDELVAYVVKPNLKVLGPQAGQAHRPAAGGAQDGRRGRAGRRRARRRRGRPRAAATASSVSSTRSSSSRPARPRATRSRARRGRVVALKTDGRRRAARGGPGARAHPRGSARAQSCRPTYRGHHQPDAGRAGGAAPAGRAPSRRHHGRDARQRARRSARRPAIIARRPGSRATRSASVSRATGTIFTVTYG